jgi:hypothetical protein
MDELVSPKSDLVRHGTNESPAEPNATGEFYKGHKV